MEHTQEPKSKLIKLIAGRLMIGIPILIGLLFLPAGTWAYREAWFYLLTLLIPMSLILVYFLKKDPALLIRRMKTGEKEPTQKLIVRLALIPFLLAFILPGLDHRFGWSSVPDPVVAVATVCILLGYLLFFLVLKENRFASRVIEVVNEQRVIQSGPYRLIRHPMYLGAILIYVASPVALGSYWALLPAVGIIPVLMARIVNEEQVLTRELRGYQEYKEITRYRLLPGIW